MKVWESLNDVNFEDKVLTHAGYAQDENYGKNNGKVSQFYVCKVGVAEVANHYNVTWDFTDFYNSVENNTYKWSFPHALQIVDQDEKDDLLRYYNSDKFTPYNKIVNHDDLTLTIINKPVIYAPVAGALRYYAGAIDNNGNVYQVYWNIFNLFKPVEIKLTVE